MRNGLCVTQGSGEQVSREIKNEGGMYAFNVYKEVKYEVENCRLDGV